MNFSILFTSEAEAEIGEAFEWYEQRGVGLGSEFLRAVEVAVSSIARAPLQYPVWRRGARRVLLRKFPFAVFYVVRDESIVVFACFHGRRNPKILLRRLPNA
jgi:plasmid stabilization system protein ParE